MDKRYTDREKRKIVKDNYNAIARAYDERYGDIDGYIRYINDFLIDLDGGRVVELGCGSGALSNYMSECGFSVVALDFSRALLDIAKRRYPHIDFFEADIAEYLPSIKYDGLITKDVLFHLPPRDLERVIKNFKNILKKGGRFCIILDIPKATGEQLLVEELDDRFKVYYNYMSVEYIKELLIKHGFKLDEVNIYDEGDISIYATGVMVIHGVNK